MSYDYVFFFFFKQKTAYEIAQCLVGSEMCIRDRTTRVSPLADLRPLLFSPRSILRAMKLASSTCSHP